MASLTYLLVAEGPTDISVIKKISQQISEETGNQITIQELSPQKDATSGRYPSHGWEEVKRWCCLNGKDIEEVDSIFAQLAKERSWRNQLLFADGIIIQMDTDIAQYIPDMNPTFTSGTKNVRKRFCERAILKWLGETTKPDELYFLLATHMTENWILATHNRIESVFNDLPEGFDFEEIENVIERLDFLEYPTYISPEGTGLKLVKNLSIYNTYAENIKNNLQKVRLECEEVEKFCNMLSRSTSP